VTSAAKNDIQAKNGKLFVKLTKIVTICPEIVFAARYFPVVSVSYDS